MFSSHRYARTLTTVTTASLITACAGAPAGEGVTTANELVGVWSLVAVDPGDGAAVIQPSQPGLYIFTAGYYSAVFAPGPEARPHAATSFQPTEDEMVAQYTSIIVNTGTYELDGSTVTFRPVIAKSQEFVGGYQTSTFRVAGDTLTLFDEAVVAVDGVSAPNVGGSLTLVRVE